MINEESEVSINNLLKFIEPLSGRARISTSGCVNKCYLLFGKGAWGKNISNLRGQKGWLVPGIDGLLVPSGKKGKRRK